MKRILSILIILITAFPIILAEITWSKDLEKKAKNGDAQAQIDLASCYYHGNGITQDYTEAFNWVLKAAKQGSIEAQFGVGCFYEDGCGVQQDFTEAVKWYRKAAEQGYPKAQNNLGECYYYGNGVNQNYTEAVKWYRKAAEQGNARAQNNLGDCYYNGEGVSKNYSEAVKWYRKAAEQGNAMAQYRLGYFYENGEGVAQNYSEAVKWFRKAAEQGEATAQCSLGHCYYYGNGVNQNYSEAVKWFRKAAEQGDARAQKNLGDCYHKGEGVSKNYSEAVKWYRKAAEQGDARAQNNLGHCYYYGNGVNQNYSEAVKWYQKGAEQGHAWAQYNLGECYYYGNGVNQNYSEAVKWYRNAAEQGDAEAQCSLGYCYENGEGVAKSLKKAVEWYSKAAVQGNELAINALSEMGIDFEPATATASTNSNSYSAGATSSSISSNSTSVSIKEFPVLDIENVEFVDNGNNCIEANESCKIRVKVVNSGKGPATGCVAKIEATGAKGITVRNVDIPTIEPNQKKDIILDIQANSNTADGNADFAISVYEPNGFGCDPTHISVPTQAFQAPKLKLADYSITCENGAVLEKRKPFDLQVLLQNIEHGKAEDVKVTVELPQNVFLIEGQTKTDLGTINPGNTNSLVYSLVVNNSYVGETIPVKITLSEKYGKYGETQTLNFHLNQALAHNKIVIEEKKQSTPVEPIQIAKLNDKVQQDEVDFNIPATTSQNKNTFAVIFGNENYKGEEPVRFAANDGNILQSYMTRTLGLPQENVHFVKDATRNEFIKELDWMRKIDKAYNGTANFIIYYAGHGVPDESTMNPMLVPVDGYASNAATCIPLNSVYEQLNELKADKVLLVLDACFSGSQRGQGMLASARGVALAPRNNRPKGNVCVLSAAQADETAWPFVEKGHGLFTYFLLKKLQETKGDVTLGELSDYIREMVSQKSIVVNLKSQTPTVIPSERLGDTWKSWKMR